MRPSGSTWRVALLWIWLAVLTKAQTFDFVPSIVERGKTYNITYSPKDETPTTFNLMAGPSDSLVNVATIGTRITGGTFSWHVDDTLDRGNNYTIQLMQGKRGVNYAGPIAIARPNTTTTSSISTIITALSSTTASVTWSPAPTPVTGGMSKGVKAGIAVGAVVGGLALVLGSFLIGMYARGRRGKRKDGGDEVHAHYGMRKAEIDSKSVHREEIHELDADERELELTAHDRPVELHGDGLTEVKAELENGRDGEQVVKSTPK